MSTVITLACMSALAGFVYYYLPRDRPRKWFRLEQFRPAAPLAGIFDERDRPDQGVDDSYGAHADDRSSTGALD
ncbi:hypothetical protein M2284_001638 [Rhodococcus sp. LBL1]|uniref:Uncharacterized protein n=1 Tax=Prescottella agglutinans TaxID=1644129 RepID=A0ABT6M8P0_9NOCA|nr:hypothetical protein [Prescottella agglutinans]MDH6280615.1 hypothetical protein [Prescottella agglutinans]MDH6677440.1 hypothetical protein [Rhodococcus sp. LBL1]MDH6682266.1 hypothetical protein [Rhodococcus sp. LBL2]